MTTTLTQARIVRRKLSFRCDRCRGVALAQAEWHDGEAAGIECGICGANYFLAARRDRGTGDVQYREKIRAVAVANGLDLATATSVFEEITPLARAVALRRPAAAPASPPPASSKWIRTSLACVTVVVSLALLAMKRPDGRDAASTTPAPKPAVAVESGPTEQPAPVPAAPESPLVSWRDETGNVTEIVGPDPASVLNAFCRGVAGFEPVTVNDAFPRSPGVRVGVVRRLSAGGGASTVTIRRDPRTGRWFIGDRREGIRLSPTHLAVEADSSPVISTPGGG